MNRYLCPPGPKSGLLGLRLMSRMAGNYFQHALDLNAEFGDAVFYRVGPVSIFQFSHPDAMHEVLVEKARSFHKERRFKQVLGRWNGNGLVLNEGESWARQRRLAQQAFHPRRLRLHDRLIVREAQRLATDVAGRGDVDIAPHFSRLTLRVVVESLFGGEVDREAEAFRQAVQELQTAAMRDLGAVMIAPLWWPSAGRRRLRAAMKLLDEMVLGFIARRRADWTDRGDLLSILLSAVDEESGGRMTDRQARDECVGLLLGGNETTSVALTWTAYLLARDPEWQQQVREEIHDAVGDRPAAYDDIANLPRLEATIKESLRLYPPAYATTRQAIEAVEIAGYPIPAGAQVHLPIYIAHHDERWWSEPETFRPERFDCHEPRHRDAFLPFGAGPRACIGKNMAMMEAVLALATLLQQHELRLADDQGEPVMEAQISLHPKSGVRMRLEPLRSTASLHA